MPQPPDGRPPKPAFEPSHPAFVGRAKVLSAPAHLEKNITGPYFAVDLGAGTCTCKIGGAFQWHFKNEKWVPNFACSHKIRMMAEIVEKAHRPVDMQIAYAKEVGRRYNMYEVVSAFHKELRRGSVEHAVFWGHMLANFRGVKGVIKYMLNILYEETRDHNLGEWLLTNHKIASEYDLMLRGISAFCKSKKKWELPHRMDFLEAEMRGYSKLIAKYGRDVAKGGDIISEREREHLLKEMKAGLKGDDMARFQYGLKGLQKTKCANIDAHRAWIMNEIMGLRRNSNVGLHVSYIQRRSDAGFGIGYHELNMFADSHFGESYNVGISPIIDDSPALKLGVAPNIPIYAHDNHTWAGKALIRKYPNEFQPGVKQEHYDLRLCGAYMGVVWRHLAFKQYGAIDCEWEDVRWPKWLHQTVSNLWY